MPDAAISWIAFTFFVGGAAGGWIVILALAKDHIDRWRSIKRLRENFINQTRGTNDDY